MQCSTVVDGAVNGNVFEALVEQVLVAQLEPGDVVIMDELSSHKRARIRKLIETPQAELRYLPPGIQTRPPNADGRGLVATPAPNTGVDSRLGSSHYAALNLAATEWAILAAARTNPFGSIEEQ